VHPLLLCLSGAGCAGGLDSSGQHRGEAAPASSGHAPQAWLLLNCIFPLLLFVPARQEDGVCEDPGLLRQLELLRAAKLMRLALICQDMADGMMAVNDITGGTGCVGGHTGRGGERDRRHSVGLAVRACVRARGVSASRLMSHVACAVLLQMAGTRASTILWCSAARACCQQRSAHTSIGAREAACEATTRQHVQTGRGLVSARAASASPAHVSQQQAVGYLAIFAVQLGHFDFLSCAHLAVAPPVWCSRHRCASIFCSVSSSLCFTPMLGFDCVLSVWLQLS
jgi:hypothetical protein